MVARLSAPLDVQWELTSWCSYNCTHCYNYWRHEPAADYVLGHANLELLQTTASELERSQVFHATLTGGEPLGVIEKAYPVLRDLREHGVRFSLNSNLSLLNERRVQLLQQLGIRSILTSLISADESLNDELAQTRGAYKRTVAGMRLAVASGFRVAVNMVVSKRNFHTIFETAKTARELGATTFCATKAVKPSNCSDFDQHVLDQSQVREMLATLLQVREQMHVGVDSLEHYPACAFPNAETRAAFGSRNCSAAKASCTIGCTGDIRPCSHAPMPYGNIAEGLQEAWKAMDAWRTGELIPPSCRIECGEYPIKCGGGCRIEALTRRGSLNDLDPLCQETHPIAERVRKSVRPAPAGVKVRLSASVRFRPETFGFVAYRDRSAWLAVEPKLYELLQSTSSGGTIGAPDIAGAYQVTAEEARVTLGHLIAKGIVERTEG